MIMTRGAGGDLQAGRRQEAYRSPALGANFYD